MDDWRRRHYEPPKRTVWYRIWDAACMVGTFSVFGAVLAIFAYGCVSASERDLRMWKQDCRAAHALGSVPLECASFLKRELGDER